MLFLIIVLRAFYVNWQNEGTAQNNAISCTWILMITSQILPKNVKGL